MGLLRSFCKTSAKLLQDLHGVVCRAFSGSLCGFRKAFAGLLQGSAKALPGHCQGVARTLPGSCSGVEGVTRGLPKGLVCLGG